MPVHDGAAEWGAPFHNGRSRFLPVSSVEGAESVSACQRGSTFLPRPRSARAHHITSHTRPVSSRPPFFFDFTLVHSLQNPARGSSITHLTTTTPIHSDAGYSLFQYSKSFKQKRQRYKARRSLFPRTQPRNPQLSTYARPTGFTEISRHTLSTVSVVASCVHRPPIYSCSCPSPRKFPCQPAVRHAVHKRNHDSQRQTRQAATAIETTTTPCFWFMFRF
jgi:hypothetical protein